MGGGGSRPEDGTIYICHIYIDFPLHHIESRTSPVHLPYLLYSLTSLARSQRARLGVQLHMALLAAQAADARLVHLQAVDHASLALRRGLQEVQRQAAAVLSDSNSFRAEGEMQWRQIDMYIYRI